MVYGPRMLRLATLTLVLSIAATAHAETGAELGVGPASSLAASATFTPGILRATNDGAGFVTASSEFNGASDSVTVNALGEVNVYGPVRIAVKVLDAFGDSAKPGVGVGVKWLDGSVKSTAYLFYKTEGFTEAEGEIESVVAFEHAFGAVHATANVAYGQDPDNKERDGELGLVAQIELIHGLFVGGTARYRDALGSRKEAIIRDGIGGASGTMTFGRIAVSAIAGVAMVQTTTAPRDFGPAATLAVGAAF